MEAKKNLCGMIPEELHARAVAEKEQLGLKTLGEYVELILKEHFEGGGITMAETKTLAFKITEELDQRLKDFIAAEKKRGAESARRDDRSIKMPHRPLGSISPAACFLEVNHPVYLPRQSDCQGHAVALGTQGCGRHWRRAFGLYPGADTDRYFYPAGADSSLCLPQHPF